MRSPIIGVGSAHPWALVIRLWGDCRRLWVGVSLLSLGVVVCGRWVVVCEGWAVDGSGVVDGRGRCGLWAVVLSHGGSSWGMVVVEEQDA